MQNFKIISFYVFVNLRNIDLKAELIKKKCNENKIKGLIIIAEEGINGTLSGSEKTLDELMYFITNEICLCQMNIKEAFSKIQAFSRLKVKIKKEIVTFGISEILPYNKTGQYIEPADWNDVISNDDTITIDTRNEYEVRIGSFKGALNPKTQSFSEFPKWWEKNKEKLKGKNIAMFCTGGIRCEKSTKFLLKDGFKNVYHLKGGILNYLKSQKDKNSLWQGECFVFDQRVSVDENLNTGKCILCHACREPLTPEDLENFKYEEGVSCPYCFYKTNDFKKNNFRERQKQIRFSIKKGEKHLKHF